MRCRDTHDRLETQPARPPADASEDAARRSSQPEKRADQSSIAPTFHICAGISTERIMQAVDQHRRVSQQLEDLRTRQGQRVVLLRAVGLKLFAVFCAVFGILAALFGVLLVARPALLVRTLDALGGAIAALLMVEGRARLGLSLIPLGSWFLSAAALVVVLLMGLWVRLMRYPQEV